MRKIFCLLAAISLCISLCGCSYKRMLAGSGAEYIISAMGFDQNGDELTVILEAVIINSEDADVDKKTSLLKGTGKNTDTAFAQALQSATEAVMLSHLGAVVIGNGVSAENFKEINDWFYNKRDTTLSTFFVSTENAEKLLSCETVSSVAVGYDIVGMLEQNSGETGIDYKNRFFQIEGAYKNKTDTVALPYFSQDEESFSLEGIQIFSKLSPALQLTDEQAFYYSLARDAQTQGTVTLQNQKLDITSAHTSYKLKNDNIEMRISLKLRQDEIPVSKLKNGINELYELSAKSGTDIFSLEDIIHSKGKEGANYSLKVIINE